MRIATLVAQILLGLIFFVFGLNGFLNFLHAPLPSGLAGDFVGALTKSHYFYLVSATQLVAGVLLLASQCVPLGLALLAPVLANILAYHATMNPSGAQAGIFATILWVFLAWRFRAYFAPLLVRKAIQDTGRSTVAHRRNFMAE